MARKKEATINGKTIVIMEYRVRELEALLDTLKGDFDLVTSVKSSDDLKKAFQVLFLERLPQIIPTITAEDVREAYPSELEEILEGFVEVNFTGMRKVVGKLFSVASAVSR